MLNSAAANPGLLPDAAMGCAPPLLACLPACPEQPSPAPYPQSHSPADSLAIHPDWSACLPALSCLPARLPGLGSCRQLASQYLEMIEATGRLTTRKDLEFVITLQLFGGFGSVSRQRGWQLEQRMRREGGRM